MLWFEQDPALKLFNLVALTCLLSVVVISADAASSDERLCPHGFEPESQGLDIVCVSIRGGDVPNQGNYYGIDEQGNPVWRDRETNEVVEPRPVPADVPESDPAVQDQESSTNEPGGSAGFQNLADISESSLLAPFLIAIFTIAIIIIIHTKRSSKKPSNLFDPNTSRLSISRPAATNRPRDSRSSQNTRSHTSKSKVLGLNISQASPKEVIPGWHDHAPITDADTIYGWKSRRGAIIVVDTNVLIQYYTPNEKNHAQVKGTVVDWMEADSLYVPETVLKELSPKYLLKLDADGKKLAQDLLDYALLEEKRVWKEPILDGKAKALELINQLYRNIVESKSAQNKVNKLIEIKSKNGKKIDLINGSQMDRKILAEAVLLAEANGPVDLITLDSDLFYFSQEIQDRFSVYVKNGFEYFGIN